MGNFVQGIDWRRITQEDSMVGEGNRHRYATVEGRQNMHLFRWINAMMQGRTFENNKQDLRVYSSTTVQKESTTVSFWSNVASDDVQLHQQHFETTFLVPTLNLTWLRPAIRKYKTGTVVAGFWRGVEYQRCIGLSQLSSEYSRALIRSMVHELRSIVVEECCWNSVLDRLEWTDYFEFLTKFQNENSWNFEYQMCIHLYHISNEYLRTLLW
jgi:hypothetical protein